MTGSRKFFELTVLLGCSFILSKAVLSFILDPEETPTQGNPAWRLVLAVSYVFLVVVLLPFYQEVLFALRRNWPLVVLVLLALLSSTWAEMPGLVLRKSVGLYGATLLGIALAVRVSFLDQLRLMSWLLRFIGVLSLAFVLLLPDYGISDEGPWIGVFEHKNAMGSVLGLSLLVEWQLPSEDWLGKILKLLACSMYLVLLLHSDSVTPAIALCGAVLLTESYKFATVKLRLPFYAFFAAVSIVVMASLTLVVTNIESVMALLGRSSNLTGRTEIWNLVLSFIPQKLILGYGHSGFWLGASQESFVINRIMRGWVMYSHNGYLEMLLNLGIVGLGLTLIFLGIGLNRAIRFSKYHSRVAFWPVGFLFYFLFHNIGECTIMIQDLEWALCVACVVGADPLLSGFHDEEQESLLLIPAEEPA